MLTELGTYLFVIAFSDIGLRFAFLLLTNVSLNFSEHLLNFQLDYSPCFSVEFSVFFSLCVCSGY